MKIEVLVMRTESESWVFNSVHRRFEFHGFVGFDMAYAVL